MLLREYLEQGLTKTALAVKLGLSRRTIHHWIETGQLDRDLDNEAVLYKKRPSTPRKIAPYCEIIHSRLEAFPELSAERVYRELRAAGYEGGYTQVKEYVRKVRPRPAPEPVVRFETLPGHQAQVDFAHFRFPWGRRWALLLVLGFSRAASCRSTRHATGVLGTWRGLLVRLFSNIRSIVLDAIAFARNLCRSRRSSLRSLSSVSRRPVGGLRRRRHAGERVRAPGSSSDARAMAWRRSGVPHVTAYWLMSSPTASHAARLTASGAGQLGNPWDKLTLIVGMTEPGHLSNDRLGKAVGAASCRELRHGDHYALM